MADTHRVTGKAVGDSEVRATKNGYRMCRFMVVSEMGSGDYKTSTLWTFLVWENSAKQAFEFAEKFIKKGTRVDVLAERCVPKAYVRRNGETGVALNATALAIYTLPRGANVKEQLEAEEEEREKDRPVYQSPAAPPKRTGGKTEYDDGFFGGATWADTDDPLP